MTSDTATHGTDWRPPYTNGYGTSLEIGDAAGLFSFVAIRFEVTSGLPDSVIADSLVVRLTNTYKVFPEFLPGLQVRIREIPDSVAWKEGQLLSSNRLARRRNSSLATRTPFPPAEVPIGPR